ncbi:MAG: hypothetical protein EOM12_14855 [Verrucomicrobiae bacterium]|nr:hypothetical protein [Verrucomicrobiae bacterium]
MEKVSSKVTSALYNEMTNDELQSLNIQQLHMFWGVLHHWKELAERRIDQLKAEEAEKEVPL